MILLVFFLYLLWINELKFVQMKSRTEIVFFFFFFQMKARFFPTILLRKSYNKILLKKISGEQIYETLFPQRKKEFSEF